jgi:flagellar hook-length control protein FliK
MSDKVTSGGRASGVDGYEKRPERERDDANDETRAAWALAFTDAVVHRLPQLALALAPSPPPASSEAGAEGEGEATSELRGESRTSERTHGATAGLGVPGGGDAPIENMSVSIEDARLGRVAFKVTREGTGLDIVIGVADSHVKALIEAERLDLVQALKAAGLRVCRVEVMGGDTPGTLLAPSSRAARSTSSRGQNAKVRAYRTSLEEDEASTAENVDLTA